jgi:hypothetical protein
MLRTQRQGPEKGQPFARPLPFRTALPNRPRCT